MWKKIPKQLNLMTILDACALLSITASSGEYPVKRVGRMVKATRTGELVAGVLSPGTPFGEDGKLTDFLKEECGGFFPSAYSSCRLHSTLLMFITKKTWLNL